MTLSSQQTGTHGEIDAYVLERIFVRDLESDSIVEETENSAQIPLAAHPHYGKILKLARFSASISLLGREDLLAHKSADWAEDLSHTPFSAVALRAFNNHQTGFMKITADDHVRVIAFSAGLPISTYSNIVNEQFGNFLLTKKLIEPNLAQDLADECHRESKSLGWALLKHNLLSVDELLSLVEEHSRLRLLPVFTWQHGSVAFYADERAGQLFPVINLPFMAIVRLGVWRNLPDDLASIRQIAQPILEVKAPLCIHKEPNSVLWELDNTERSLIDAVKSHQTVEEILLGYHEADSQAHALRSLYTLAQMGLVRFDTTYEPRLHIPLNPMAEPATKPGSSVGVRHHISEVEELRTRRQLEMEGRRYLNSGAYKLAVEKLQELCDSQETPSDATAYLAVAKLLADPKRNALEAEDLAKQAIVHAPENPLPHAAMSRILEATGEHQGAGRHKRRAIELSAHDPQWLAEAHGLLGTAQKLRERSQSGEAADIPVYLLAVTVLLALSYLSNLVGLGKNEHLYQPDDFFFVARRLTLALAAIAGLAIYYRANPLLILADSFAPVPARFAVGALLWGGIVGYFSPGQGAEGQLWVIITLIICHVVCEELFFRGLLTRLFLYRFASPLPAICLSAVIFGVYHLSYQAMWFEITDWTNQLYWMSSITLFAGLPYAWLYHRTRSLMAPIMCHAAVNLVATWMSLQVVGG